MNKPLSKEADALIKEIADKPYPMETETLRSFLNKPGSEEILVEHSENLIVLTAQAMMVVMARIKINSRMKGNLRLAPAPQDC